MIWWRIDGYIWMVNFKKFEGGFMFSWWYFMMFVVLFIMGSLLSCIKSVGEGMIEIWFDLGKNIVDIVCVLGVLVFVIDNIDGYISYSILLVLDFVVVYYMCDGFEIWWNFIFLLVMCVDEKRFLDCCV